VVSKTPKQPSSGGWNKVNLDRCLYFDEVMFCRGSLVGWFANLSAGLFATRSSATTKSTARPSCLVVVLYDIYRRQTTDQQLISHLYETGQETYRIPRNNAK